MHHLALELDDRAVATAANGRLLSSSPSAVFDGTAGTTAGANAWRELRVHPRAISTRHLSTVLTQRGASARAEALLEAGLKARLAGLQIGEGQRMWIVVPAQAEAAGLTALLGITRRMGLPVDGFVDGATVTTAGLGLRQNTIVLELGLHHAAATVVDCSGSQARRRRAVHTDRGGLIELYQMWLDLVSTTMVKRTRFDPLHDAATEQHVFESIPALAMEAGRAGSATGSATRGADRFEVSLTRDQFAQAAQPIYREIIGLLHQLRPAGVPVTIVMPQLAAQLPGLREQLEQFVGCELISVPDGFAASATSLLDLPAPPEDESAVSLVRRLPLARPYVADFVEGGPAGGGPNVEGGPATSAGLNASSEGKSTASAEVGSFTEAGSTTHAEAGPRAGASVNATAGSPAASTRPHSPTSDEAPPDAATVSYPHAVNDIPQATTVTRTQLGQRRISGPAPSHVLWEGRAYPLHPDNLVIGREPTTSPRHITLPDGLAGVSRRHCTFVHDGDELVLLDHSTFGTFVNGERVQERVRIYAGDRLRLGAPGVELTLIAVGPQQP